MLFPQAWSLSPSSNTVSPDKGEVNKKKKKNSIQRVVQIAGRIILPIITAIFVLGYVVAAAHLYNNPVMKYH